MSRSSVKPHNEHWYVRLMTPNPRTLRPVRSFQYIILFSTFRTRVTVDTFKFSNGVVKVGIFPNQSGHFHFGFGQFKAQIRQEICEFCLANILADFLETRNERNCIRDRGNNFNHTISFASMRAFVRSTSAELSIRPQRGLSPLWGVLYLRENSSARFINLGKSRNSDLDLST